MNITWYSHYFAPEIGAPSARIYDLSKNWLNMGHQVQVATCYPNHPSGKLYSGYKHGFYMYDKLKGIDVHRHWTYITPNKGFAKKILGHISFLPSALLWSNRHIGATDVVIGSSPTFFAAMAATVTGISRNIPFIMEVRDLWPAIFVELGILKNPFIIRMLEMLEMALYHKATRVISVTESFRRNLINRGISASKVVTIPNGADTDYWQPAERSSHLKCQLGLDNRFIVLYIGAHGISHALGRILDAAERLRENQNIHFLFVGEGAEKDQLIRRAQQARLENVDFLKPVDRKGVREFYAIADVCLVPLRDIPLFETFIPSKMFEIMAMGRPIIGSLRGEGAEIIRQSGAGIVLEPEDLDGIVQAILYLFRNREEGQSMGENGRYFVCKNYSRDSLAIKYAQVINEAIREFHDNNQ